MHFGNPSGLWALAGLLIPVAIHLLSRKEGRTIAIGSLRHLSESPTARFRHIRPNELALLALRCLLILLLAFILGGLHWNLRNDHRQRWIIVEKGIANDRPIRNLIDSLNREGFEPRLLAKGFPALKDSAHDFGLAGYWSLVEDLRGLPVDSVIVLAFNHHRNFRGRRVNLPPHVRWLGIESPEVEFVTSVVTENDSSWVRRGSTSPSITHFQTVNQKGLSSGDSPIDINIHIVSSDDFSRDKEIVVAALRAVQSVTPHRIKIATIRAGELSVNDTPGWLVWLSDGAFVPVSQHQSIVYKSCAGKNLPLLTPPSRATFLCGDSPAQWIITSRLNEELAWKENLALTLASIILPSATTASIDNRVLPETLLWSGEPQRAVVGADVGQPVETLLIITLLIILTMERWLAYKKHQ